MALGNINCLKQGQKTIDFRLGRKISDPFGGYLKSFTSTGTHKLTQSDYMPSFSGFATVGFDPSHASYETSFFRCFGNMAGITAFYNAPKLPMSGAFPLVGMQRYSGVINGQVLNCEFDGMCQKNVAQEWPQLIFQYSVDTFPAYYPTQAFNAPDGSAGNVTTNYNIPFLSTCEALGFVSWPNMPGTFGALIINSELGYLNLNLVQTGTGAIYKLFADNSRNQVSSFWPWLYNDNVYVMTQLSAPNEMAIFLDQPSGVYGNSGYKLTLSDATDNAYFNNLSFDFVMTNNKQIFVSFYDSGANFNGSVLVFSPDLSTYFRYDYFYDENTYANFYPFFDVDGNLWLSVVDNDGNYFALYEGPPNRRWRIPLECVNYCLNFFKYERKKIV